MTQTGQAQPTTNLWLRRYRRMMIGGSLTAAQRRLRLGWIAGFAAAAIDLAVAIMSFGAVDPEGRALFEGGGWAFTLVLVEGALLAALSWGVVKRQRTAAAALFWYFLASKTLAYALGWGHVTPGALLAQVFLGYLLFQGMRGVYTWHHLTHPEYPEAAGADAPNT